MRRGHSGIGAWRNDIPRRFRPRGGGTPHFRPPRNYGMLETLRFPPPGPRPHMGFNTHPGSMDNHSTPEHRDRNNFRPGNRHNVTQRPPERGRQFGNRQIFPMLQRIRQNDMSENNNSYQETPNYFDNQKQSPCHINNLRDIDFRKPPPSIPHNREAFRQRPTPWSVQPPCFEEWNKSYRHRENTEFSKIPVLDYAGHRPPSSDHYDSNMGAIDNSNAFSRSVDDTVDIVRKRLLNRESQQLDDVPEDDNDVGCNVLDTTNGYQESQNEQPIKRKVQRQRQNVNSNCNKIKNKIVHQLFMMDKDKIHKLMDNPNSSSKFEYAINSLVTESQNSYNRHLRSVAEKSLCSSGTEFMHNDNNTIYEDTFMKQMQCLLDPQDSVLLEDLKPMVLAELSKVLQLDDFDHRHEMIDEHAAISTLDKPPNSNRKQNDSCGYDDCYTRYDSLSPTHSQGSYVEQNAIHNDYDRSENTAFGCGIDKRSDNIDAIKTEPNVLCKRSQVRKSFDYDHENERRRERQSTDSKKSEENFRRTPQFSIKAEHFPEEKFQRSCSPILPLFNPNAEQLSEDDDPFAELDNQYHVAVDHNFIATDDIMCPQPAPICSRPLTPVIKRESRYPSPEKPKHKSPDKKPHDIKTTDNISHKIKEEMNNQLQSMTCSPLKLLAPVNINEIELKSHSNDTKHDNHESHVSEKESDIAKHKKTDNMDLMTIPNAKFSNSIEKSETCMIKSSTPICRKRSADQKPSHRKEKRKKSDPNQPPDTNKQILNKNIIINVNDCATKSSEKCDNPKSIFNLFFAKDQNEKDKLKENKKDDTIDKSSSEKYVKRKDAPKKQKDQESECKKKHDSVSSSHSILSPTDGSNTTTSGHSTKTDLKTKLKTIDMFVEQPRKSNTRQPYRNTAPASNAGSKTATEVKTKQCVMQTSRKLTRRHVATQVIRKSAAKETQTLDTKNCSSRFSQTDRKKLNTRGVQTDPVIFKTGSNAKSGTFERMKEIDMEIQALLQEKFKLYSSLESNQSCPNTMQSLGMAVLNVTSVENTKSTDDKTAEDTIVEEFTNIPAKELEEIAFESIQEPTESLVTEKRTLRPAAQNVQVSESPIPSVKTVRTKQKKTKTPNISLIEQIITDDRPIEDIISLDDLEGMPHKSKKKKSKKSRATPKKKIKKIKIIFGTVKQPVYDIKPCSVVLIKTDLSKYLQPKSEESVVAANIPEPVMEQANNFDESVMNDIQFDMLDVSEDIIIGDVCQIISVGDKDVATPSVCEEIILDNSQSSVEDTVVADPGPSDDQCKMYDFSADENLRRDSISVTGNGDAVLAIECIDNNFIAASLDGNVYYFSGEGQLISTLRGSNLAVTCLTIVKEKYGVTIYTGSLDSRIRYYDLETGLEKGPECNVLSPIQTMDCAWDTIFVGTKTGFVLQFECKNNMLIPVSTVKFSEQSILALRAIKEGPRKVLLVAARAEQVAIKDAQTGLLLRTLEGPKMTVYTLLYEDGKVYCGTSTNLIHVFDYASGYHVGSHEGGKGAVCLRATGGLVFAGCYDGCVYVYRDGESRPLAQLRGPGLMLLSLAIVGSKIIAGYKDRSLYIWKIPLSILQEMIL